jgi:hypothetical protein
MTRQSAIIVAIVPEDGHSRIDFQISVPKDAAHISFELGPLGNVVRLDHPIPLSSENVVLVSCWVMGPPSVNTGDRIVVNFREADDSE